MVQLTDSKSEVQESPCRVG